MAGFRIKWVFGDLGISEGERTAYFGDAERRWANVITGWPHGPDGAPALSALTIEVAIADLNPGGPLLDGSCRLAHVDLLEWLPPYAGAAAFIPTRARMFIDANQFQGALQSRPFIIRDLIAHEIGHALGFGKIWSHRKLIRSSSEGRKVYSGDNARAEYASWGGGSDLFIEDLGDSGTALDHWKEDPRDVTERGRKMFYDLMSGTMGSGDNRLSRLTVASMSDLGYDVNMNAAEPYRVHD
jgi:hypothetical protein